MSITIETVTTEVSVTGGITYTVQLATSGLQGAPGPGVPAGGTTGQILAKTSGADYATAWEDHPGVPVTSVDGRIGDVTLSDLYDPAGSAAGAEQAAKDYADGLAPNYDIAGAAESARIDAAGYAAAAETNAKNYADGLAVNYDPAGAAAAVTTASIGAVPTSRTVNGKPLTGNVTLSASDVGADPAGAAAAVTTTSIGAIPTSEKAAANGVATLGNDGLVPTEQLPPLTSALADLTDVALNTPASGEVLTYNGTDWTNASLPPGGVTSVNSQTGAVVLDYTDVGADPAGAAAAITLSGLGGVPTSRTVNGHALSGDVTVTSGDLGLKTQRRHDWQAGTDYSGTAVAGLAEGTTGWTLTKIVVASAGTVTVTHATDSWSNHLTASYS